MAGPGSMGTWREMAPDYMQWAQERPAGDGPP